MPDRAVSLGSLARSLTHPTLEGARSLGPLQDRGAGRPTPAVRPCPHRPARTAVPTDPAARRNSSGAREAGTEPPT